jgi:hypothetical protein
LQEALLTGSINEEVNLEARERRRTRLIFFILFKYLKNTKEYTIKKR